MRRKTAAESPLRRSQIARFGAEFPNSLRNAFLSARRLEVSDAFQARVMAS
jgi:hypothetical protein